MAETVGKETDDGEQAQGAPAGGGDAQNMSANAETNDAATDSASDLDAGGAQDLGADSDGGASEAGAQGADPTSADAGGAGAKPASGQGRSKKRASHAAKPTAPAEPRSAQQRAQDRREQRRVKALARRARRLQERQKARAGGERGPSHHVDEPAPVHIPKRGAPKERQGVVVSDKAEKTITVRIDVARQHRRYGRIVRSSTTLHAHDESNEAHEGDVVRVVESRPLSRTKRWRLASIVERAQ